MGNSKSKKEIDQLRLSLAIATAMPGSKQGLTLNLGKPAPPFAGTAIVDGQFKEISSEDYKGKYLVIFFYPMDFTLVCPTEVRAFSEAINQFRENSCEIVAVSTDTAFSHFAWVTQSPKDGGLGPVKIPMLADKTCNMAKAYCVYKEDDGTCFRGLFIIDKNQNLRQVTINDTQVGRSVEETLRLVQAFQYTDVHGEVCPAGWHKGQAGIKTKLPSMKQSKSINN